MNLSTLENNIRIELSTRPLYKDIFYIIILLGLNPITYFFFLSPGIFPPDSFTYLTMAKDLFQKGLLYLPSWGHVDTGLILPPLYPFLIAIGSIFSPETLTLAEIISSISMLIFVILLFFYLRMTTNRLIAVIAITLIQLNYFYFLIGMRPLTESVFLLTIGLTLLLTLLLFKNSSKKQKMLSIFLGISCALVFFSRQVGGIIFLFVAFLFMGQWLKTSVYVRRVLLNNFLFVVCGSLLLIVPYTVGLYLQTGQHLLTQRFKKNEYNVKVSDPEILAEIKRERELPDELLKKIKSQPGQEYGTIYAERRRMRKLLPDSSEMYGYVSVEGKGKNGNITNTLFKIKNLGAYSKRLYNNILNLKFVLGIYTIILFFISCISALIVEKGKNRNLNRFILPAFVIIYLLVISIFTDKIERYIYILFPFCIMQISIEAYRYFKRFESALKREWPGFLLLAILFPSILLTTPRFFTELHLNRKFMGVENQYGEFNKIVKGEPVFSLFALEAYLIGSPYRFLPNDSLEKVAAYGKKTGVRWILIYHGLSSVSELKLYTNLAWYSNRLLGKTYPDLVKLRLVTKDGTMVLYEIL